MQYNYIIKFWLNCIRSTIVVKLASYFCQEEGHKLFMNEVCHVVGFPIAVTFFLTTVDITC